ncbi:hypothetical protein BDV36DRAFT_240410 [Aspergillus pseudocaelatus]|uniref:Uncharacterized protein n=1 Tax=Aspergillus pseudocaelatus TaxID=1825620 RepID=A0ABQ6WBF8_9EURO|nr:hypothetical protein BDV36DRAFT_240410 [Aspergillus pseudocaelatus]
MRHVRLLFVENKNHRNSTDQGKMSSHKIINKPPNQVIIGILWVPPRSREKPVEKQHELALNFASLFGQLNLLYLSFFLSTF